MATWCLIKSESEKLRKAIKNGEINPSNMASMTSAERRAFLEKFVSGENAKQVNALFESKLILKNQKAGMISWAKRVTGVSPQVKRDMLARIERLQNVLSPKEEEQFLNDLVNSKLGLEVTREQAQKIADLSKAVTESKKLANKEGIFPNENARLKYGADVVALENYTNELKLEGNRISLKEQPLKAFTHFVTELPGITKSAVASFDNSFWGRQGIKAALDVRTTNIWLKNFLKSWKDIVRQTIAKGPWYKSGEDVVMDAIKADIYSRPNALNGKYKAGGYGLDVYSEEAYPSSLPEKIPLLGRLFKATESAYNGGALRLRADLADRYIKMGEKNGLNMLDKKEAQGFGSLVSSLTGRGNVASLSAEGQKNANNVFFSVKFVKSNFDTLTAHLFDSKATSASRKEAAKNLLSIIASLSAILTTAKIIDKNSVEEDPRSNNFGKIKIFGHWTDLTGGMAGIVHLVSQIIPTYHNGELGFWSKTSGGYRKMDGVVYGQMTALDVFESFFEGKLSPVAGTIRNIWKGKDYSGQPTSISKEVKGLFTPIFLGNIGQMNTPDSAFPLGSIILDALGFSVGVTVNPNTKSGAIPEGSKVKNEDLIKTVMTYAEAVGVDPETAFKRFFAGERIRRVDNGTIIVERMPLAESQAMKKKLKATPEMKLDHTIPLELGGSNDKSNLKLVTTSEWSSYTPIENALGRALKAKKITKEQAQKWVVDFKEGRIKKDQLMFTLEHL